ncbi:hypothetical protein A4A49_53680 [Nicotiana attenuata]|uniref:S-protein homolog n=1 Tax=Nicotiana attenuata TaxID=49451 RepID=A0A314KY34_NICAT|nr:hypothetical protein A4A49_53680 [Nicotiana attenuata]
MASSILVNVPILVLFLFITCSLVASAPETYYIDIIDSIPNYNLHVECDLNGLQYPEVKLTGGAIQTYNVDVDLPRPGGNYVLSCDMDYGTARIMSGLNFVLFDYQRDKSRCANKRCSWEINEDGAFLKVRLYEFEEQ